jgi:hypothetical protein
MRYSTVAIESVSGHSLWEYRPYSEMAHDGVYVCMRRHLCHIHMYAHMYASMRSTYV